MRWGDVDDVIMGIHDDRERYSVCDDVGYAWVCLYHVTSSQTTALLL